VTLQKPSLGSSWDSAAFANQTVFVASKEMNRARSMYRHIAVASPTMGAASPGM
jgi:hypothetical protein